MNFKETREIKCLRNYYKSQIVESLGNSSRYKIIVQTTVGQLHDQGIRVASRGLWDPNTDNYASASYANVSLAASASHESSNSFF
jgi:hypothetical protein